MGNKIRLIDFLMNVISEESFEDYYVFQFFTYKEEIELNGYTHTDEKNCQFSYLGHIFHDEVKVFEFNGIDWEKRETIFVNVGEWI